MANLRREPVAYRPFRADPLLAEGLIGVERPGGELERQVAAAFFRLADRAGRIADEQATEAGALAGSLAALEGAAAARLPGEPAAAAPGTTPPSRGGALPARAPEMQRYLVEKHGLQPHQAAAILGNLVQESQLRTDLVGDNGTAFGMAQWREGRAAAARKAIGDRWNDPLAHLDFLVHELRTSERGVFERLQRAGDVDQATEAMIGYFRPRGWKESAPRAGHGWDNRLAQARRIAGRIGQAPEAPSTLHSRLADPGRRAHVDRLNPAFRQRLETMLAEAPPEIASQVRLVSGYRTPEEQAVLWKAAVRKYGSEKAARKWVAPPGRSRHNHGNAFDLDYGSEAARQWVHANASRYGLAFPLSNEPWHIELAGARTGQSPGVDPSVRAPGIVPAAEAAPAGSPRFRPTGRRDAWGRAYDAAGTRTYLQRLETETLSTLDQVERKFAGDPDGMRRAIGELKAAQLRDDVFPEIRADWELFFDRQAARSLASAETAREKKREEDNRQEFLGRAADLADFHARAIAGVDPEDEGSEARLRAAQAAVESHWDSAVLHGIVTRDRADREKRAARNASAVAYYAAQARDRSPAEIEALRETLREDFAEGRLEGVDADGFAALDGALAGAAAAATKEEARAAAALAARAAAQLARVESGFDPDPAELARLHLDAGTAPDGEGLVDRTLEMIQIARAFRDRPPAEARRMVEELVAGLGKDASDDRIAVAAYAQKLLAETEKKIAADPVGWEIATGRLQLEPIDASSPEALRASLAARKLEMTRIAAEYRRPFEFFRPEERQALLASLVATPDAFPDFAAALAGELGPLAANALAEIAPEAPALAHAAGLALATGDRSVAVAVAQAISARQQGQYAQKLPADQKLALAAGPRFAAALAFADRTRAAALATATLIYERDANLMGFDPARLDDPDSPATMAWRRAIERALGARQIGGVQFGGIAEINGGAVVAPPGLPVDRLGEMLSDLTDEDLAGLPPILSANGLPVTAAQIRRGRLVSVGDGLYRVALGDPLGFDPRYLAGGDGDFWTLDAERLDEIQRRRSAARNAPAWPGFDAVSP